MLNSYEHYLNGDLYDRKNMNHINYYCEIILPMNTLPRMMSGLRQEVGGSG